MSTISAPERGSRSAPEARPGGPLRLAVVNDYEVIVAGVATMLEPYADRVLVTELDVEGEPHHEVDLALFDTYGQPSLGLQRLRWRTLRVV